MAELKTKPNKASVKQLIDAIDDEAKGRDSRALLKMMKGITGARPKMWGESIVGFGDYHYRYASGREGDWFITGFSPRKPAMTVYLMCDISVHQPLLANLGKYKIGKSCLYFKKPADIDQAVLRKLIETQWAEQSG